MKRIKQMLLAAALLLCALPAVAQADGYRPMVRPGVKWVYSLMDVGMPGEPTCYIHITYEFRGEETFDELGLTYMKCWRTVEDPKGRFGGEPELVAYVREEGKKVYAVYDERYIGATRYFWNGYREYDPESGGYGLMHEVQGGEMLDAAFAGMPCWRANPLDEYLIYDFNDIPAFYEHHPQLVYDFGKEYQGRPQDNVTAGASWVTSEAEPAVICGRSVKRYKLEMRLRHGLTNYYYPNAAPASPSCAPAVGLETVGATGGLANAYKDKTRYVLEGYGDVHNLVLNASTAIAYCCRSFLSPMAMFRNPLKYWGLFDGRNAVFNFCHIEEDGQIVYKSDSCDYFEEELARQRGGDVPSGVSELPVGGGAVAGGRTYDMQGRAVTGPLQPGIYVRDGQKLLVE